MKRIVTLAITMTALSGCGLIGNTTSTTDSALGLSAYHSTAATDSVGADGARPSPADFFAKLDADGDGYLTQEELKVAKPPASDQSAGGRRRGPRGFGHMGGPRMRQDQPMPDPAEMITRLDTDNDGKLSLAELEAGRPNHDPKTRFKKLDADGFLTTEELSAIAPPAGGKQAGDDFPKPDPAKLLEHLDTDKDGKVSLDEFKQGPGPMPLMFGHRR